MTDPTKCATSCGRPVSPRGNLCQSHDDEWRASGERKRADGILDEYAMPITRDQNDGRDWRLGIALGDFVRRISVEIAAVKLGKVVAKP